MLETNLVDEEQRGHWKRVQGTFDGPRANQWHAVGAPIAALDGHDNQITDILRNRVQSGMVLVDFGCGTGKLLAQVADHMQDGTIIGVDINRRMAALARDTIRPAIAQRGVQVLMVVSPIETCPLPNDLADIVVAKMVLHHVPDPGVALAQMARVVRPGGHLMLMVPGKLYQADLFEPTPVEQDPLGRFSQDELERLVGSAGLFPLNVYVNRFRFLFDTLGHYFRFMDGIGATSKLLGYSMSPIPSAFLHAYRRLLDQPCPISVPGEYLTVDCIKDASWQTHSFWQIGGRVIDA